MMPLSTIRSHCSWLSLSYLRSIGSRQSWLLNKNSQPTRSLHHICDARVRVSTGALSRINKRPFSSTNSLNPTSILVGRHVKEALANGQPVVALESTVITHGLPEPKNLELALRLEHEISNGNWWTGDRDAEHEKSPVAEAPTRIFPGESDACNRMRGQVVPATVGIIRGQLIVGLSRDQIEFLANKETSRPIKASRRDLALAQAVRLSAGTTVSATMAMARSVRVACLRPRLSVAGISVFATGGLGGVHLGGQHSMDISADLYEMARSPIGLVSSGFKSFLDARLSLEFLETMGCTVASLRQSARPHQACEQIESAILEVEDLVEERKGHLFPGFFTSTNRQGARSPWQCADVQEAARILFHCLGPLASELLAPNGPISSQSWSANQATNGCESMLKGARAMLLACPIPGESSLDQDDDSDKLIEQIAQRVGARTDLSGHEKTPLILAELARSTGGRSLEANLALLRNNARIGAHLAYEYSKLREQGESSASDLVLGASEGDCSSFKTRALFSTK